MFIRVTLLLLFWEFLTVGLFTVGGGMAALPLLYDMAAPGGVAERLAWFTTADVTDMLAISQSTPGPVGINMATFIGFRVGNDLGFGALSGALGSLLATIGVVLPSCVIVLVVAKVYERFKTARLVKDSFLAIRPAVTALITLALFDVMGEVFLINGSGGASLLASLFSGNTDLAVLLDVSSWLDLRALLLFAAAIFAVFKLKRHPIIVIAGGAVAGLIFAPWG
jgi:chromate transporter